MSFTIVKFIRIYTFIFYSGSSGWMKIPSTEISLVKRLTNVRSDKGDVILILTPM